MAASSSSFSLSNFSVTLEEIKTFHNIDRMLYTKLVLFLNRDPAQSMQVMAFWLWLERSALGSRDLVYKMLSLADSLINSLVDEAFLCLSCIQNDQFHFSSTTNDVPLICNVVKTGLSLRFFYDNRITILRAVTRILNEVCARAFEDILRFAMTNKAVGIVKGSSIENKPIISVCGPVSSSTTTSPMLHYNLSGGNSGLELHGFDDFDLAVQRQFINNEICDLLSRIEIRTCNNVDDKGCYNVPADDRTIFLTFSKGYPISEDEVRDFFTRKYGNCIEAIYMQEVMEEDDQPLYARLVGHPPAIIQVVLEGKNKAKFSISGKHAWARKYVRKNTKLFLSPPQPASPSSPSQPTSPTESITQA